MLDYMSGVNTFFYVLIGCCLAAAAVLLVKLVLFSGDADG